MRTKPTRPTLPLQLLLIAFALLAAILPARAADVLTPCFLKLSIFDEIPGATLDDFLFDPRYPSNPSQVFYLKSFNTREVLRSDELQNFGGRIAGFITPLETGNYHFFLRSDAASQLWLSSDQTEANATLIAEEPDRGDPFMEPDTFDPATTAAPIALTAGQRYFIMLVYKGSSGGGNSSDYAQVAWRKEGDTTPAASLQPIPGAFLSTMADNSGSPAISFVQQPANVTAVENSQATFTVAVDATPADNICIQWQRNGINIPGATGDTYTRFIDKADAGATFRALVAVPGASATSAEATVTVTDDKTAPVLLSANGGPNRPQVTLTFSERLNSTSATTVANYRIASSTGATLPVTAAELSADGTQVKLTTDTQTVGTEYTVTVNNLTDRAAAAPNAIAANSQAKFFALGPWIQGEDGFVVFEAEDYDRNLDGLWIEDPYRGTPSGGRSMVNPNGAGGNENNTKLEYDIFFTKTGRHIIWYRAVGNDGNDDSAWFHLDGERPPDRTEGNRAAMSIANGLASDFVWRTSPFEGGGRMTFNIETPGLHTIGIGRREDGAYVDKFVITTDSSFNPTASFGPFGPSRTLRQGEPIPEGISLEFALHPSNTEAVELGTAILSAEVLVPEGTLVSQQWQRKEGDTFVDIPDATGSSLTIPGITLDWNGAVVRLKAGVLGTTKFSNEATITVTPERDPPQIVLARGLAQGRVTLFFSEPLTETSAQRAANYSITSASGSVPVHSATLLPSGRTVALETGPQTVGTKYTVTVNGVTDRASTPNPTVNAEARFFSAGALRPQGTDGLIVFEAEGFDRNTDDRWIVDSSKGNPSGGLAVVLPNGGGGNEDSKLEYDLTFTQTGTHIVWYRGFGPGGSDDSAFLHLDGARPANRTEGNQASMSGINRNDPNGDFVWRSQPQEGGGQFTIEIDSAGLHTLGLARREDGSYFDKFVITTDPEFRPDAFGEFGPNETREGIPPLPALAITAPADGATLSAGSSIPIAVDITATGRTASKVEFFEDVNKIGESTSSPFGFTWANVPAGVFSITARLTDDVGAVATSDPVLITVEGGQADPGSITISRTANGIQIGWETGTLESAPAVTGPWTAVAGAAAPSHTIVATEGQAFFRVRL